MLFAHYYSLNKSLRLLQNNCICTEIRLHTAEVYLICRATFNHSATSNVWNQIAVPAPNVTTPTASTKWKEHTISHKDNSFQSKMLTWWVCIGLAWPQNPWKDPADYIYCMTCRSRPRSWTQRGYLGTHQSLHHSIKRQNKFTKVVRVAVRKEPRGQAAEFQITLTTVLHDEKQKQCVKMLTSCSLGWKCLFVTVKVGQRWVHRKQRVRLQPVLTVDTAWECAFSVTPTVSVGRNARRTLASNSSHLEANEPFLPGVKAREVDLT